MALFDDLFVNLSILGMLLFTLNLLTRKRIGFISPGSSLMRRMQFGTGMGLLGIILMEHTIYVNGTILDLRQIPVVLAAVYGGVFAPVLASVIIAAGRILLFGIDKSTIYAASLIVIVGVNSAVLSTLNLRLIMKWLVMSVANLILTLLVFFSIIPDRMTLLNIYAGYASVSLIGGVVILYLMEYLKKTKELYQTARKNATTDFLTGLNNVRKFEEVLRDSLDKADRHQEQVSFILIDIDHFKQVNDRYGHVSGDEVLKQLSEVLSHSCRSIDIVSRNGGEEFSVILPSCSKNQALEVADRMRTAVARSPFKLQAGTTVALTVSMGVSTYRETTFQQEDLIRQADACLYEAKRAGRNQVVAA